MRERLLRSVEEAFQESIRVKEELCRRESGTLLEMALLISGAFRRGDRLFLFGNGGSAADAQHLAAEFVNRFVLDRPPLPALALTVDTSVLTSIGNDFSFEEIFVKQLRALGRKGDVVLGISTSGASPNVTKALQWASENGLITLGFSGTGPGAMDAWCERMLRVPSTETARVQEAHITAGHILCALVEKVLFAEDWEDGLGTPEF
ncbi:MAG: D-sedoheptulose 7-phosphate isomerase [Deltaproteobacteria bacterium]|nr:D-sedoheptulose 7-phosphate isomerase [Deltaproteobacteria bacterium]